MPDSNRPGEPPPEPPPELPLDQPPDLPPDLPPEYAEAYRRGYERAIGRSGGVEEPEPTRALRLEDLAETSSHRSSGRPAHREAGAGARAGARAEARAGDGERPVWMVPVLLAGLVVLLIASAFVLGKIFSSRVSDTDIAQEPPDGVVISEDGSTGASDSGSPAPTTKPQKGSYRGTTHTVAIGGAEASCQAPASRDAAGHPVRYAPVNVYDGDLSTAWRCNGDGVGEVLTLELPQRTDIGEVGLVPGYAKTDPRNGVDRYAENNRITKVRWTFSDGTAVEQSLDGSPDNRDLQSLRIPVTAATQVQVEVLDSTAGSRNTVAVSEVRVGATGESSGD